ncbi:MAG: hypothetical protein KGJ02_07115 [Verrucomicrobiota bacterium]|nr:hypothetical protein [Verrucomicrobiota bacterium]
MKEPFFSKNEQTIRKVWVWSLGLNYLYELIIVFLFLLGVIKVNVCYDLDLNLKFNVFYLLLFYGVLIPCLLYYFSYKKYGTKLLTWSLWLFWIEIFWQVSGISKFVAQNSPSYPTVTLFGPQIDFLIGWGLSVYWFILNVQLRRVNRRVQESRKEAQLKLAESN